MNLKQILTTALFSSVALAAAAQQVTISPLPQSISWGEKAFDNQTAFNIVGAETADADALNALTAKYGATGGSIELIIGERGDDAVAAYEASIPSNAEGYFLQVTPERVVIAGNDGNGTFYGVQSFLQIAAQAEVMSVTITDFPDVVERGVVEGFYGNNWSQTDRLRQLKFYGANKMNVYIYGPKDDPYHRGRWREPYPTDLANKMAELVEEAKRNKVNFVWAIHPGEDIQWNKTDSVNVVNKLEKMYALGVRAFAVFFDDVYSGEGTRGIKQAQLLNYVTDNFVRKYDDVQPLILCPTQYNRGWVGGSYLSELRDNLYKEVRIMWTGNSVVDFINKSDTEWINNQIGRKAYIWLNYPVNDYCISRMLMGPTWGDDLNIADDLSGYTANPMEYAEASMLSLYSVADYTWNMTDYDSNASWERAIKYLMPENADAFKVFCENNVDLGVNTHGLRRTNESPRFVEASKNFDAQMAGGYNAEALNKVRAEFDLLVSAADQLLATSESPELIAEITPWVKVMRYVGQRGQLLCGLFDYIENENPEAFIEDYLKILDLTEEQRSILSRDFPGSIKSPNPVVADVYVGPFIKKQLENAVQLYKQKFNYRLDVFPAEVIEYGTYYIMYNGKYLGNPKAGTVGGNPVFQDELDLINPSRQEWLIAKDTETGRYKIINVKDDRYINEHGNFSVGDTNPYEAVWHTYEIYCMNGKYAIQNAGKSGTEFWATDGTRISKSGSSAFTYDHFVFDIVPLSGAKEFVEIKSGKKYAILNEAGEFLTNTNPNGTGGAPKFQERKGTTNKAQYWNFSLDKTQGRYKLTSARDSRYVNELGEFGTNQYYADWNTYFLLERGGFYSFQNGGSARPYFWYIDGDRIYSKDMDRNDSYQFRIMEYDVATGIDSPLESTSSIQVVVSGGVIHANSAVPVTAMRLYDAAGQCVAKVKNASALSLPTLISQTYLLNVVTETGQQTFKLQLK